MNASENSIFKKTLSANDDLAEKLSKDPDFENFCFKAFTISSKISLTNSKELISKLANGKATEDEQKTLFRNLNFKDLADFKSYGKEIFAAGERFLKKFPELNSLENKKQIIVSAILLNENLKKHIQKAEVNKAYPIEDCAYFIVLANLCWTTYPYDQEAAFNCWTYFLALYDGCVIFSE